MNTDLRLDWCSMDAANFACEHFHYARVTPAGAGMKVGVWEAGAFIGVIFFSRGANLHIGAPYGLPQTQVCELTRVALRAHRASVTRMIAIALRMLKAKAPGLRLVVSYADPAQQHVGGIYQAGNWIYVGVTQPGKTVIVQGKRRHHRTIWLAEAGSRTVTLPPKHKYLMPLDVAMRQQLRPLAQPFPKRERSSAGAAALPRVEGGSTPTRSLQNDEGAG